ncbi:MAG TPA: four helix bundle protein [Kofleriaceae bacterium]|nr:four helix bundle protein [Kofleriaceae bacterium]
MFIALEVALQLVAAFRPIIEAVMPRDKDLAGQMRRAVTSAPLNTAEGNRRNGGDRIHAFRVAAGEAEEAVTAARVALALGYIDEPMLAPAAAIEHRLQGLLWGLRGRRR